MTRQKTIVITRPDGEQLAEKLREIGYQVEHLPVFRPIGISLDEAAVALLSRLTQYTWILFTSRNGVRFFPSSIELTDEVRIAAIGESTADLCRERFGRAVAFEGGGESSEKFCAGFFERVKSDDRMLLVTAREHRDVIESYAREREVPLDKLIVYDLERQELDPVLLDQLAQLPGENVYWPFFSPSAFRICAEAEEARRLLARGTMIAIGDTTRAAIEHAGFPVYAQAVRPSESGMLELFRKLQGK